MKWFAVLIFVLGLAVGVSFPARATERIRIGSKRFTESYVLGEIAVRAINTQGFPSEHRQGMGGTIVLWQALTSGAIDAYPDYTGTIAEEILRIKGPISHALLRAELARHGVGVTEELGFNNTYALVMRRARAEELGIRRISDLRRHPGLVIGLTHEFLERQDGWKPLSRHYKLGSMNVRGIDHALGYAALLDGTVDVKDAYSTDAKIAKNGLVVLEDDRAFFPSYKAVFLYRLAVDSRVVSALRQLEGTLTDSRMIQLNAVAERTKDYARAAALYFDEEERGASESHRFARIGRATIQHIELSVMSLALAVILGIPLGILASRPGATSYLILGVAGLIQTVPSLALLALLVPWLGISGATAVVALLLYSLLPIIRNTASGLQDIPDSLRESAAALGLEPGARLRKILLPLASRSILAGIKTSAVINIGTATLAALIGAGGLGELIISGLSLNDHATILDGAIPAACLALLAQGAFTLLDRVIIPRGLRNHSNM